MNELLILAPPPVFPIAVGNIELWGREQIKWNLSFPEDYVDFINRYGNGRFNGFFGFPSPFYASKRELCFADFVQLRLDGIKFAQRHMPKHTASFPLYPTNGGLFPIGYTDNGGTFFWETAGAPSKWKIVCMDNGYSNRCDIFDLPVTDFVSHWLENRIVVSSLTPPDFFPLRKPVFVPLDS